MKNIFNSKTIWFQIFVTTFAVLSTALPAIENVMTEERYAILMVAIALVNGWLRTITTQPVSINGTK